MTPSGAQTNVTLGSGVGTTTGYRWDTNTAYLGAGVAETQGDFYLSFGSPGSAPKFWANNVGQRALADLGDLGAASVTGISPPPVAAYTTQGVAAVAGHTYAALTRFGDTWDYAVFKVTDVQNNGSVTLEYALTNLAALDRTLNVTSNITITNAAGIGNVTINSGQALTVDIVTSPYPGLSGDISGAGSLVKSGAGNWYFMGNATHTGGTTITAGTLGIGNNNDANTTGSIAGDIINNGTSISFNRRDGVTYAGSISGTGQVGKFVPGDLTFTGTNTHSGITSVSAGRLIAGAVNTLSPNSDHYVSNTGILQVEHNQAIRSLSQNGTVNLANGSVLTLGNSSAQNYSGVIQGNGSLVKSGTGTQILSGDNTFSGMTTVTGGTLQLGNGGTTGSVAGGLSVSGAGSLAINRSDNMSLSTGITGTGGLTKSGSGTLTLTGSNTYSGNTTFSAGIVVAESAGALSANSRHSIAAGATLQLNADQTVKTIESSGTVNITGSNVLTVSPIGGLTSNFSGVIQGSGSLLKSGAGILVLSGTNTYAGGTTIEQGSLFINTGGSIPVSSIVNNGSFGFVGADNITWSGNISGTGTLVKNGTGTLTLTGINTYSGITNIAVGSVVFQQSQTFSGLAGTTNGTAVINGGVTLTLNSTAGNTSFSGAVTGAGGIIKTGTGTQIFSSAASTYAGGTVINGGTIALNTGATIGTGSVTVNSTGLLRGDGSVTGNVTINAGGAITGGRQALGTLNLGNATFESGAIFQFGLYDAAGTAGTATGWGLLALSGVLDLNGTAGSPTTMRLATIANSTSGAAGLAANFDAAAPASFLIASAAGGITGFDAAAWTFDTTQFQNAYTGSFALSQSGNNLYLNYATTAIPEPSTCAALAGLGVLLVGVGQRRWSRGRQGGDEGKAVIQ